MDKRAKWIGSRTKGCNTWNLNYYRLEYEFIQDTDATTGLVFAARNKDNYLEILLSKSGIQFFEYTDNAWKGPFSEGVEPSRNLLCEFTEGSWYEKLIACFAEKKPVNIVIEVNKLEMTIIVNNIPVCFSMPVMPKCIAVEPRVGYLMMVGIKASKTVRFNKMQIFDCRRNELLWSETEDNADYVLGGAFNLIDPVPSLYVFKSIDLKKYSLAPLKRAVLYSSARGFYESYIDGKKVGTDFYAPGFTDYRIHIDYQKNDVTKLIEKDTFLLSAIVTKGYYTGFCGYSGAENYGQENSYICSLKLEFEDGATFIVNSDESFLHSLNCPVIFADYLDGEYFDAGIQGMTLTGKPVRIIDAPGLPVPTNGSFEEKNQPEFSFDLQNYEGAKIREILRPVSMLENPKGHFVYDFGQNIVGTVAVKFKADAGAAFKLRYGEMSYKNGEIYIQNIRTAANTDVYIARGEDDEFIPSFTSHGFRYVEITGSGRTLENADEILSVTGLVINNLVRTTGGFECSDKLLNKLQKNIEWGQKGNYLLVPTDCPQRNERMGWTGDAQVFAATAAFNMDVKEFTRKWLRDLREATIMYNRDGAVPDTAPLGGDNRPGPCGGWADAAVIVPYELYLEYADEKLLLENYEMMRAWVEYQSNPERETDGVQLTNRRGDHLAYDTSTPPDFCATAYAARCSDLLARCADILGKIEDAHKYARRFQTIREGFCKKWVNEEGSLKVTSQTCFALAIDFGLIKGSLETQQKELFDKYKINYEKDTVISGKLAEDFAEAISERDFHLSVGFLGISHLLPALTKIGRDDLASCILLTPTEPGWLYSVLNGATTIWERWNSYIAETGTFGDVNMNSFNHYCYGSVGDWMYQTILGIKRLAPGYKKLLLRPVPVGNLTYAKGYHICNYGQIDISWKITEDIFTVCGKIPMDVSGQLIMPDGTTFDLVPGEEFIKSAKL